MFFPKINKKGNEIMRLSRDECAKMIRWTTGHNFLRWHQGLVDKERGLLCLVSVQGLNDFLSSRLVADLEGLQVSEEDYDVGVVVSPTQ